MADAKAESISENSLVKGKNEKRWPFGLIDRAMDSSAAINDSILRSTIEACSLFCMEIYRFVNRGVDFLQARKSFVAVIDFIGSSFRG